MGRELVVSGLCLLLVAFGCGARTELVTDEAAAAQSEEAGGSAGAGSRPPEVSTRCELVGDDPRVAGIKPDEVATLNGADFVVGDVKSYHWTLQEEDCDAVVKDAQFTLQGANSQIVKFQPSRPAFYHFTLEVVGTRGDKASCKLEVPVKGVGMRVELCWDTSTTTDLDLYLHTPFDREPWFTLGIPNINLSLNNTTCNTSNATAQLRDQPRVNWGYADSEQSACNTPSFQGFLDIGRCPNPRAADDNNQSIATGTTERMQLDNPLNGQTFRAMVQNFSNSPARPHVFVYCGGERAAAFDGPTALPNFVTDNPGTYGVMWRAADIVTRVDATGKVSCTAEAIADGTPVTIDEPWF